MWDCVFNEKCAEFTIYALDEKGVDTISDVVQWAYPEIPREYLLSQLIKGK